MTTGLILLGVVLVTLKFREELIGLVSKIPVVGSIVS
jgi:hypothetical protein